jgi:hypothetical protein
MWFIENLSAGFFSYGRADRFCFRTLPYFIMVSMPVAETLAIEGHSQTGGHLTSTIPAVLVAVILLSRQAKYLSENTIYINRNLVLIPVDWKVRSAETN